LVHLPAAKRTTVRYGLQASSKGSRSAGASTSSGQPDPDHAADRIREAVDGIITAAQAA
jgi:hypothetical protein